MNEAREAAGVRRPTLLLVDEHKMMRQGIAELVKQSGDFEVIGESGTAMEAVHILRARHGHVIVMGSRLQDLSGIHATRLVLREFPMARVVLLSALENREAILMAMRSGAMGFVLEKSSSSHLFDALRAVSENRSYIDPNVSDAVIKSLPRQGIKQYRNGVTALSCRELEILHLVVQGKTSKEIAALMCLGVERVRYYRKTLMKKLEVCNVARLINFAFRTGLIKPPLDRLQYRG